MWIWSNELSLWSWTGLEEIIKYTCKNISLFLHNIIYTILILQIHYYQLKPIRTIIKRLTAAIDRRRARLYRVEIEGDQRTRNRDERRTNYGN